MDAIQLKFNRKATNKWRKAVEVDPELCIGCGVCVVKCKPKSIMLKKKPEEEWTEPPKTGRDMVRENVMAAIAAKQAKSEGK